MTSSILPRSEALQFHDARFEKLFEQVMTITTTSTTTTSASCSITTITTTTTIIVSTLFWTDYDKSPFVLTETFLSQRTHFQYDEEKLGALDDEQEDIGGTADLADVQDVLDEFLEEHKSHNVSFAIQLVISCFHLFLVYVN